MTSQTFITMSRNHQNTGTKTVMKPDQNHIRRDQIEVTVSTICAPTSEKNPPIAWSTFMKPGPNVPQNQLANVVIHFQSCCTQPTIVPTPETNISRACSQAETIPFHAPMTTSFRCPQMFSAVLAIQFQNSCILSQTVCIQPQTIPHTSIVTSLIVFQLR